MIKKLIHLIKLNIFTAELLNYIGEKKRFNDLVITGPMGTLERLYYIENDIPIIEKLTVSDDDYDLIFEKEKPNNVGVLKKNGIQLTVRYLKNMEYKDKKVQQHLLTRIYKNRYKDGYFDGTFERLYTYGAHTYIKKDDTQDKYTYIVEDSIIYGINEYEQRDVSYGIHAICYENAKLHASKYLPYRISNRDYPILSDGSSISAMVFQGTTIDSVYHSLEIYKKDNSTNIKYYAQRPSYKEERITIEELIDEDFDIPVLHKGMITNLEINKVIEALQIQFDDDFINIVIHNLREFGTKIDVKNGVIKEKLDLLAPKTLLDKTFDEISSFVNLNRETYFSLANQQFISATNISNTNNEQKRKSLK